jgi:hypothetical protein
MRAFPGDSAKGEEASRKNVRKVREDLVHGEKPAPPGVQEMPAFAVAVGSARSAYFFSQPSVLQSGTWDGLWKSEGP